MNSVVLDAFEAVEREEAAAQLAGYLRRGSLALLLGAGVSSGVGLPGWGELVERCESAAGLPAGSERLSFMQRMDRVRIKSGNSYKELVRRCLYQGLAVEAGYPEELLQRRMLIALGALVMNSARGSVTDVLTLNFDDVLDWYLHLHGFSTQVVTTLPSLISTETDLRVLHMHGFLPLNPSFEESDWLVLSHGELISRIGDISAPWPVHISSLLQSRVLLAVGTSMNDIDIDVILSRVSDVVAGARPVGFVLDRNVDPDRSLALAEWGVRTISFDTHDEIPEFLLGVCRRAASSRNEFRIGAP